MAGTKSRRTTRLASLCLNYPNWRAYLITRAVSILWALLSLLSLGLVAEWNRRMLPATRGWQWASWEIQWCLFVPGMLSWLWGVTTISKAYFTSKPVSPAADLVVDLSVCIFNILAFVFITTVTGPMQWFVNNVSTKKTIVYAGIWETIGLVVLILLFLTHILLFMLAWRATFAKPVKRKSSGSSKKVRAMRKAIPDEEAVWFSASRESRMDPWFRKYMGPSHRGSMAASEDTARRKTKFDLPAFRSKSELHLNRLGNSWEYGSVSV